MSGRGPGGRRRRPHRAQLPRILVVGEGGATERGYFTALNRRFSKSKLIVKPVDKGPYAIVSRADRECEKARSHGETYDQVWALFDHDRHGDLDEALALAKSKAIDVALSIPCFEVWLLLHVSPHSRPLRDGAEAKREVEARVGRLANQADFDALVARCSMTDVTARAGRLRDRHNESGCTRLLDQNPVSEVDRLLGVLIGFEGGSEVSLCRVSP